MKRLIFKGRYLVHVLRCRELIELYGDTRKAHLQKIRPDCSCIERFLFAFESHYSGNYLCVISAEKRLTKIAFVVSGKHTLYLAHFTTAIKNHMPAYAPKVVNLCKALPSQNVEGTRAATHFPSHFLQ